MSRIFCLAANYDVNFQVLEEIMRSHEDEADYHKVPTLGKHYSHKWAVEDMVEEQKEGTVPKETFPFGNEWGKCVVCQPSPPAAFVCNVSLLLSTFVWHSDEAAIKLGQIQNKLSAKRNKGILVSKLLCLFFVLLLHCFFHTSISLFFLGEVGSAERLLYLVSLNFSTALRAKPPK